MEITNTNIFTRRNLIIVLFVVFLFLRLFVYLPYIHLNAEQLKYLEPAKHFPYHLSANNQPELLHGPMYPYFIHFANFIFQKDYIAGIFVSFISAIIAFFVLYKLFMLLSNSFNITFIALILYTLSTEMIISSTKLLKESFLIMLTVLVIYSFVKGLMTNSLRFFIASAVFGSLLALTADHVVFIFPTFILAFIIFGNKKNLKYAFVPFVLTLLVYSSWIGFRAYQYSTNEFYPNNLDGGPVETKDYPFMALIDPHNFKDWEHSPSDPPGLDLNPKRLVFNFGYMFNLALFEIPRGLNFTSMHYLLEARHVFFMVLFYLPLSLIALFSFIYILKDFIKTKMFRNNAMLFIVCLFFVYLFPVLARSVSPRNIYMSYIFLFFILGFGISKVFKRINFKYVLIVLLIFLPIWYLSHSFFLFSQYEKVIEKDTIDFINDNVPLDKGIMLQSAYRIKMDYWLEHRLIGMPPKPDKLFIFLDYYDIDYIIHGSIYTWERGMFGVETVEFIMNHPESFELVGTVIETENETSNLGYTSRVIEDKMYIYKVLR